MAKQLHPQETLLLGVVATHLVFLPWALGAMHVWSQSISGTLSALSLALTLVPRRLPSEHTGEPPRGRQPLPALLRFPIFWLGLAFLAYTAIQGFNSAWGYVAAGGSWWLEPRPSIHWLPSGVRAPFDQANAWRSLLIYGSAWMSVCAIRVGFTRRKSLRILLSVLAVNAFLLALFGMIERATGTGRIFWSWTPPASYFVSSFIYRNHAGAYFDLALAVCCALAFWHHERRIRRQERSGPAVVFGLFGLAVAEMVFYSYSRGATLLMAALLVAVAITSGRRSLVALSRATPRGALVLAIAVIAVVIASVATPPARRMLDRFRGLESEAEAAVDNLRIAADQAAWAMARDRLLFGWGAGSFRYVFTGYQSRQPELIWARDSHRRLFFEHAHNDYLEFLAESGIVGCALLATGFGWYLWRLASLRAGRNPVAVTLLLGCLVTLVHAAFDFPFFNPAVLITWCCLWPVNLRWLEVENGVRGGTASGNPW